MTEINKYNNSKIYKIQCRSSNKIYIGSTCQSLAQRLSEHVSTYKHYQKKNDKSIYIKSYEILSFGDYEIVLLEQCNYNNKQELLKREGYYMTLNKEIIVNRCIAGRNQKQYKIENKEHIKDYRIKNKEHFKEYYIEHKEHIKERQKKYDVEHKEHIKEYRIKNKEHIKEYRIKNKEHMEEYRNKYRRLKKQKQNEIVNSNIVLFEEQITILHKSFELPKINVLEKNLKILYKKQLNYYNSLFK